MAVAQWRRLRERHLPLRLVDAGGGALEEGIDPDAPLHQERDALHIGGEVGLPVVAPCDGEVQDVVEVVGHLVEVGFPEIDPDGGRTRSLQLRTRLRDS